MNTYRKIDDATIEITKAQPPMVLTYTLSYLQQQEASTLKYLADIRDLISQARLLGLETQP